MSALEASGMVVKLPSFVKLKPNQSAFDKARHPGKDLSPFAHGSDSIARWIAGNIFVALFLLGFPAQAQHNHAAGHGDYKDWSSRKVQLPDDGSSGAAACLALLAGRCPSAIGWLVIPVVVDAVNPVPDWPGSHVGDEAFQTGFPVFPVSPSLAYADSATAVMLERRNVRVFATSNHRPPHSLERVPGHAVHAIWMRAAPSHLRDEAAARFRFPARQVNGLWKRGPAAVALA